VYGKQARISAGESDRWKNGNRHGVDLIRAGRSVRRTGKLKRALRGVQNRVSFFLRKKIVRREKKTGISYLNLRTRGKGKSATISGGCSDCPHFRKRGQGAADEEFSTCSEGERRWNTGRELGTKWDH